VHVQRILVIEDDAVVRKALKRLFESQGYTVDLAGDGMSGLETFHKQRPSAVVLDLHLPRMSGQDVCREIACTAPEVPIIVLSGNSDELDKVVLLEMGARDYVTKPFSPRELPACVGVALRTAKSPSVKHIYSR